MAKAGMKPACLVRFCSIASVAILLALGAATAEEKNPLAVPLSTDELDPDALDAARRYFAMPAMQGLSAARHDPTVIAHRVENALPDGILTDDQREALLVIVGEELSGTKEESDATTIRVLAHVYTAEELEAMIAFGKTEAGRSIAGKRPIYSVLIREATGSLRSDALGRIIERFTGFKTEPKQ